MPRREEPVRGNEVGAVRLPHHELTLPGAVAALNRGRGLAASKTPAFTGGLVLATADPDAARDFAPLGHALTELLKLGALFLFGVILRPVVFEMGVGPWIFAVLTLVLARPAVIMLVVLRSPLSLEERLVAGWFGPRGFASVFYAILVLKSDVPGADRLATLAALVIALSMIAHSTTDVPIVRWFAAADHRRAASHGHEET